MIVLMNVKITDQRIGYPYNNGRGPWQPKFNRYDIFRYCMASYAAFEPLVTKYHLYLTLGPEYQGQEQQLEEYIKSIIPEDKLAITWSRNDYTRDWRKTCDEILSDDEQVIWFAGNDDHIFIDYNLDMVAAAINTLKEDPDPLSVVYYSHWPEQIRMCHLKDGQLTPDGNFVKFHWDNYDGIQMFKAARFKRYWFDRDYGNEVVFRPDNLKNHYGYLLESFFYAPTREMVRHYDGYVHIGMEVTDHAPCLYIPPGFFTNDMKIRIGFDDHSPDYTNFNPKSLHLYNSSVVGADNRFVEEDIPLFWKSKITEIKLADNYDHKSMLEARDQAFLKMSRINISCFDNTFSATINVPPVEWFKNHLRAA